MSSITQLGGFVIGLYIVARWPRVTLVLAIGVFLFAACADAERGHAGGCVASVVCALVLAGSMLLAHLVATGTPNREP